MQVNGKVPAGDVYDPETDLYCQVPTKSFVAGVLELSSSLLLQENVKNARNRIANVVLIVFIFFSFKSYSAYLHLKEPSVIIVVGLGQTPFEGVTVIEKVPTTSVVVLDVIINCPVVPQAPGLKIGPVPLP